MHLVYRTLIFDVGIVKGCLHPTPSEVSACVSRRVNITKLGMQGGHFFHKN